MKKILLAFFFTTFVFGCAEASYDKGVDARKNGDHAEALHQWLVASDDPRCMTAIGVMYDYGEGLPKDDAKAAEWYKKAAEKGEYRAIAQLANFSLTGAGGVARTPVEWRGKLEAIEGKDGYADYILASFYMDGYGGEKDLAKASSMLRALVDKGYPQLEAISRQAEQRLADQKAGVKEADFLTAEMANNSVSFDRNFKDRRIVVSGWVNTATLLNDKGYVVKFGAVPPSPASKDNILAVFYAPPSAGGMPDLKSGSFIKLSGVYTGKHPFALEEAAFTLFGCSLVEHVSEDIRP